MKTSPGRTKFIVPGDDRSFRMPPMGDVDTAALSLATEELERLAAQAAAGRDFPPAVLIELSGLFSALVNALAVLDGSTPRAVLDGLFKAALQDDQWRDVVLPGLAELGRES